MDRTGRIGGIIRPTDGIAAFCRRVCKRYERHVAHDCMLFECPLYAWNPDQHGEPCLAWFVQELNRARKLERDRARKRGGKRK